MMLVVLHMGNTHSSQVAMRRNNYNELRGGMQRRARNFGVGAGK